MGGENKRLAVQELLVWTAQAAIQQTLPVRFEVADGSTKLFGSISTDQDFTRLPSGSAFYEGPGAGLGHASRPVTRSSRPGRTGGRQGTRDRLRGHRQLAARPRHHQGLETGHAMVQPIGAPMQGEYAFKSGISARR